MRLLRFESRGGNLRTLGRTSDISCIFCEAIIISFYASRTLEVVLTIERIRRREVLAGFAAACVTSAVPALVRMQGQNSSLRIDPIRLRRRLEELSVFGRPSGGTFNDGVSRFAYSDADVAGRKYAMDAMRAASLNPRIDAAGNIFGARAGSDHSLLRILFGSHIDSVPSGGNFDGAVGSLSAIEIMQTFQDRGIVTRHPFEMVIWSNEEGGLVGSRAAAGELEKEAFSHSYNGIGLEEGLRKIGGDAARIDEARIAPHSFRCYLELHIEQGGNLEKAGIPIGVVEGIVSIDEYEVEIRGFANHAGTTPMPERRNALAGRRKINRSSARSGDARTRPAGWQRGPASGFPQCAKYCSGTGETHNRIARSRSRKNRAARRRYPETRAANRSRNFHRNCDQKSGAQRARRRDAGNSKCDRASGSRTSPCNNASAKRSFARRANDGAARADGNDFCPQPRRHQPFAARIQLVGSVRKWSECAAANVDEN